MTHDEELAGLKALERIAGAVERIAKVAEHLFEMNVATVADQQQSPQQQDKTP
jgi:hypothetical protein